MFWVVLGYEVSFKKIKKDIIVVIIVMIIF